ncbi:MAG TPA: FAD-dependent oxidoreductase [Nocardioidaceae bacterium]|nr:FAD-dependent oxidoreductase [Nocardioidaceae bacterium]
MDRQQVVIVGAGFAGVEAARGLGRLARKGAVEITMINPTDYFLYLPLLPEVTGSVLDPRRVAVSLHTACPSARLLLARVDGIDLDARRVDMVDPEGNRRQVRYDWLVLAAGSTNKLLPMPGVAEHAHGYRSVAEALYLRDHLIRQIELADAGDDGAERDARCTFVVVGAGYKAVTRGYHLLSLPANRIRVASDWTLDAALPRQAVEFGLIRSGAVPLDTSGASAQPSATPSHADGDR